MTLAWAQLLAGTEQPVLSNVTSALPHLAPMKWIPSIRNFLHTISGRIEVKNLPIISLQREHNRFLMDIALNLYSKPSNLQHLNAYRLHLQVTLLSDITMADGKFIRPEVPRLHQPSLTPPKNSILTSHHQTLPARPSGELLSEVDILQGVPPTGGEGETMVTP